MRVARNVRRNAKTTRITKITEISKKYAEYFAKGPNGDEYLTKEKAALPPEQLKIVEEKLKAQMEQWQKMREQNAAPGSSI